MAVHSKRKTRRGVALNANQTRELRQQTASTHEVLIVTKI